jgi:integrase
VLDLPRCSFTMTYDTDNDGRATERRAMALRWKRIDLLRGTLEVAETYSGGEFGSPKTKSSRRIIPISSLLRSILENHRRIAPAEPSGDLIFQTPTGTPLDAHNLYNRELAPACDRIAQPRVSWHSFRHTHATLLSETGESLKTAQALLGHSDIRDVSVRFWPS